MIREVMRQTIVKTDLKDLQVGDKFEVAGIPMVVIGERYGDITIQQYGELDCRKFSLAGCTKYEKSDIKEYLETGYGAKFPKEFLSLVKDGQFFLLSEKDITPATTKYQYYKDTENRIKFGKDGKAVAWWLSDECISSKRSRKQLDNTAFVRLVASPGNIAMMQPSCEAGIAPACVLHFD